MPGRPRGGTGERRPARASEAVEAAGRAVGREADTAVGKGIIGAIATDAERLYGQLEVGDTITLN